MRRIVVVVRLLSSSLLSSSFVWMSPRRCSLQRHSADATTYFTSDASKASVIAVGP